MRQKRGLRGSGELRHKIVIEHFEESRDDFGGVEKAWKPYVTVWAKILPISSKEFLSGSREVSEITHKIVTRYTKDVLPNMRVKFGSREFTVEAPLNYEEKNEYLLMMCKEIIL